MKTYRRPKANTIAWGAGVTTMALLSAYDLLALLGVCTGIPGAAHIDLFGAAMVVTMGAAISKIIRPMREIWLHGVQFGRESAAELCECGSRDRENVVPLPLQLFASDLVPHQPGGHRPSPRHNQHRRAN